MTWGMVSYQTYAVRECMDDLPEKLRRLAARMVITTRRSPFLSAYRSIKTAARRLTGSRSHNGNGGGL